MTRTLLISLVIILLLTSFDNLENRREFEVHISYTGLPNPSQTKYEINEDELKLYEEFYNPNSDSITYHNSHDFKEFDGFTLSDFLYSINWDNVPAELITPAIDGYLMRIDLKLQDKRYSFNVKNTYHPTIDSLLTICNEMIPSKRTKDYYKIYYEKR